MLDFDKDGHLSILDLLKIRDSFPSDCSLAREAELLI